MKPKVLQFFIAFSIAIFTTGFLRLQLFSGLPSSDDGYYVYSSQRYWETIFGGLKSKSL